MIYRFKIQDCEVGDCIKPEYVQGTALATRNGPTMVSLLTMPPMGRVAQPGHFEPIPMVRMMFEPRVRRERRVALDRNENPVGYVEHEWVDHWRRVS